MSVLTKAELRKARPKAAIEKVDAPELGDDAQVCVRQLCAADAAVVTRLGESKDESADLAGWCALAICDAKGGQVFTSEDLDTLQAWPLPLLRRVFEAFARLNGLDDESGDERKNG